MRATHRRAGAVIGAGLLAASLAGCITLLPKSPPAQLYRFGEPIAPAATEAPAPQGTSARPVSIRVVVASFDRAAAGDRILTSEGETTAYLARARWVEPALNLFQEAVRTRFEAGGALVPLAPADPGVADERLSLDVERFEARYEAGRKAPPTVIVAIHAASTSGASGPRRDRRFEARVMASADSLGAVVSAFDLAARRAIDELATWSATPA